MENNTAINNPANTPEKTDMQGLFKILSWALCILAIILFLFVPLYSSGQEGVSIKNQLSNFGDIKEMKEFMGFTAYFIYLIPVLWIATTIVQIRKPKIAAIIAILGFITSIIFLTREVSKINELFGGWVKMSLNFSAILFFIVSAACIAVLSVRKK